MQNQILDMRWAFQFKLPVPGNMMESHASAKRLFAEQGTRMFMAIESCIRDYKPDANIGSMQILDFGCGNGRVALPFFFKYQRPSACADVDEGVVNYLREVIPGCNPIQTPYVPPLPYRDDLFDCIYAISVWTHLPPDLQDVWLRELKRVLAPGGLLLISTSAYAALNHRRTALAQWGWADVTEEDLRTTGMIFHPCPPAAGITGTYGNASHDPEWVRENWSKYIPVRETRVSAIEGTQDIHILTESTNRRAG